MRSQWRLGEMTAERRAAARMFVGSMLGILVGCAVMLWVTGLLDSDMGWPLRILLCLALLAVAFVGSVLMMLVFYSSQTSDEAPTYLLADEAGEGAEPKEAANGATGKGRVAGAERAQ